MIQGYPVHIDPNSILLKCDTCFKQFDLPYSMYKSTLLSADPNGQLEYITLECVYCEKGTMIPKKYYNKIIKK